MYQFAGTSDLLICCLIYGNLLNFFNKVTASVLSSSKLEACVNTGEKDLDCEMKIVLLASLEHGQDQTETAQFMVRDVTDEAENAKQLLKPWRVGWSKTPAFWRYPVRYVQDVNNKPTELIKTVGWLDCGDNPLDVDEELTCGVARIGGRRVPDSEGFCCGCDIDDITGGAPTRGNLKCSALSMKESAHCLYFDNLWYSILEVERPQMFYSIIVSIARPENPNSPWNNVTYKEEELTLSHNQPMAATADGSLRVQLVGDLATAAAPHRFESKYLAMPTRPLTHPRTDEKFPLRNAMLVDRSLFDLSGFSCNKIGVSYNAFKTQAQKCERRAGSCLQQQLDDLHNEDAERLEKGQPSKYLVSGFCDGAVDMGKQHDDKAGTTRFLACPLQQRHTTLMRLEARAEDAMFVTNVATGRVVSAEAKEMEALSGGGKVDVTVVSTGRVTASFMIGLTNCSGGLASAPAFSLSMGPYETAEHSFKVFAQQTEGGSFSCISTLHGALGDLLDKMQVQINVTDVVLTSGSQVNGAKIDGKVAEDDDGKDGGNCDSVCSAFSDIPCFIAHSCWERLFLFLLVVGLVLSLLACAWVAAKRGIFCKVISWCLCPSKKPSKGHE